VIADREQTIVATKMSAPITADKMNILANKLATEITERTGSLLSNFLEQLR